MSLPQDSQASDAVLASQDYWRLFTELQTSGDIYELDVSAKAIVIGPNSDLNSVKVTYFDPFNLPVAASDLVVSVGDPFIGRLDALLAQKYPTTGGGGTPAQRAASPARAFITPNDIYQDTFIPRVVPLDPLDIVSFTRPRIDVLAYFSDPATIPAKRAERIVRSLVPIVDRGGGTGVTFFMVPHYRRKRLEVRVLGNGAAYTSTMVGVTLSAQGPLFSAETLLVSGPIPATLNLTTTVVLRSSSNLTDMSSVDVGFYDYIYVAIAGGAVLSPLRMLELTLLSTDED